MKLSEKFLAIEFRQTENNVASLVATGLQKIDIILTTLVLWTLCIGDTETNLSSGNTPANKRETHDVKVSLFYF